MVVLGDRHRAIALGKMPRQRGNHVVRQTQAAEIDKFVAEMRGLGLRHVGRGNDLLGQQMINQALGVGVRLLSHWAQLVGIQHPHIDQ